MKTGRLILGACVSVALAALTVSRVDIRSTADAATRAAPIGLLLGLVFAWLEIMVRAERWRTVLGALGRVSYTQSLAYTLVGAFGNLLLPIRLGDVAKGYLAANATGLPKLATLGSVGTERLVDGVTTVALAGLLALTVPSLPKAESAVLPISVAIVVGLIAGLALLSYLWRHGLGPSVLQRVLASLARFAPGARILRSPRGAAVVVAWTLAAYCCAVLALVEIADAVGLHLTLLGAAFAMAWIALSTAIPAGPGSVGTYEFVGVAVLSALNQDPSASLAAVVLLHLVGTIPPALAGLVAALALHVHVLRPAEIAEETAGA